MSPVRALCAKTIPVLKIEKNVIFYFSGSNACTGVNCPSGYKCHVINANNFQCKGWCIYNDLENDAITRLFWAISLQISNQ